MDKRHLDREIATALSYESFQLRRLRGEDGPSTLDSVNRRLYALPSHSVQREAFIADREHVIGHQGELSESRFGRRRNG